MGTAVLTRGAGYFIQSNHFYTTVGQSDPDWTWYIGQWRQDWGTDLEYGAGCIAYTVPKIDDRLLSRTISIPFDFYGNTGMCEVCAVLSTKAPESGSLDFRYGPTSGIISDVQQTAFLGSGARNMTFNFKLTDSIGISGQTIYLYLYSPFGGHGTNGDGSSIVTKDLYDGSLTYSEPYSLSINADSGSTITVNRTSSGSGSTGVVSNGAYLYYGDKLKITFSPKQNYKLLTTLVNGKSFTSGNTMAVSSDVTASATSQPLASEVGATDANIESSSSITIMPFNSSYVHTLKYTFGSLTGTIVRKTNLTSYSWKIPTSFYNQIPDSPSGKCVIICETYDSGTMLGTSSCEINIIASEALCSPSVTGTVIDTNENTKSLTGDSSVIVRYLSNVSCAISATAKNGSKIVSMKINNNSVSSESPTYSYTAVDITRFSFTAVDSRGYATEYILTPTVVQYIKLTINPILSRPSMTSNEAMLSFNGNFYNGSFGLYANALQVQYRYKLSSDATYGSWITIDSSNYIIGSSNYYSKGSIQLLDNNGAGSGFEYQQAYDFQIRVIDGANGTLLSSKTVSDVLKRGEPVFDWGESDFNFNVDVRMFNESLVNIFYPVGSVFMSIASEIPDTLSICGMVWEPLQSADGDIYKWKRVS